MAMDQFKREYYLLLRSLGYLSDSDFQLTAEDQTDGVTSVEQKLEADHSFDDVGLDGSFAVYKNPQGRVITIMKGEEGIESFVKDKLEAMEKDDLIQLIGWLGKGPSKGYRGVLEEWNWKLQEHGEYFISETTEMRRGTMINKLMQLANQLDDKGFVQEADVIDGLIRKTAWPFPPLGEGQTTYPKTNLMDNREFIKKVHDIVVPVIQNDQGYANARAEIEWLVKQ